MADILNSIIHSSDNAVNGLYNAMSIRRQKEQDTQAAEQNAYSRSRDQQGDKQYYFEQAAKIVGGRPENVQQGLDYLAMNGPPPDPRVGDMLVAYGQSLQGERASLNPTWGEDAEGNPILVQITDQGARTIAPPEGVNRWLPSNVMQVKQGDQTSLVEGRTGRTVTSLPINVSPDQQPELKGQQQTAVNNANIAAIGPTAAVKAPADASVAAAVTTATEQARSQEEKRVSFPKVKSAMLSEKANHVFVTETIDDAIEMADKAAGMSALGSIIPESDAKELNGLLTTIKSNIGFAKLKEMREQSKTGGAMGNLTEREFDNLVAIAGNLEQSGKPKTLKRNLARLKAMRESAMATLDDAYQNDYSDFLNPGSAANGHPSDIQQLMDKYAPAK